MMNKLLVFIFSAFLFSNYVYAKQKVVPFDMALGYWEASVNLGETEMFQKLLENVPEEQRASILKMMEEKTKSSSISKQCITSSSFDNMEAKMKEAYGGNNACKFEVEKSTNKVLIGKLNCPNQSIKIQTKVIDSKHQESEITTLTQGMGESKMKVVNQWKSSTCPAGL